MIFSPVERLLAFRYLRARRQEGFVSVIAGFSLLGIALGVMTLIIVMAVMNGFREELLSRILGVNSHITLYADNGAIQNYESFSKDLRAIPDIQQAIPDIQGQAMVTAGERAQGAIVRGITAEDLKKRDLVIDNIKTGTFASFEAGEGVLIGRQLALQLGVRIGDRISLITPQGNATVIGTIPRIKSYPVAGTFEVGMFEYDSSFIYMPLDLAQVYFRLPEQVNAIEIFLSDADLVEEVVARLGNTLPPGFRFVDWQQANSSFFNAIKVERNVMFLILTLIILVAAFNIISGQIMLVKDKGREIAILRTMGASRGSVMRIFLLSGASIGIAGTTIGAIGGVLFADNIESIRQVLQAITGGEIFPAEIYFLSTLPAEIDPYEVVTVILMSLGLSLLATVYPSWRAARLDPVEALRYE